MDFADGVNVIMGSSNQGKSAMFRALYWVKNNRPLGVDTLASHWIVNDKGNLTGEMSAVVVNDRGAVERRRTKDENQYIVDGEVLNVVKTDVPEQVSSLLKLSDTNVQKQLDAPFLLSQTSGETAKYFNSIVNLDVIDRVLSKAESRRRSLRSTIESTESEIVNLEGRVQSFSWVEEADALMEEYSGLQSESESLDAELSSIQSSIDGYRSVDDKVRKLGIVAAMHGFVDEMEDVFDTYTDTVHEMDSIMASIDKVNEVKMYDFTLQKRLICKIEVVKDALDSMDEVSLSESLRDYDYQSSFIESNNGTLYEWKNMLPATCPYCGHELKEDQCVLC